jgi:hypothetical protein
MYKRVINPRLNKKFPIHSGAVISHKTMKYFASPDAHIQK